MSEAPNFMATTGARPDLIDLRDQQYQPALRILPPVLYPDRRLFASRSPGRLISGVRDQGVHPTCVAHALASLIDIQRVLQLATFETNTPLWATSAHMLHCMARQYDMYGGRPHSQPPNQLRENGGIRSLRSAIKAFYHHGICLTGPPSEGIWCDSNDTLGNLSLTPEQAHAAAGQSLSGYYRLSNRLDHYHSALLDCQCVLVSARVHNGWSKPVDGRIVMPANAQNGERDNRAHAFLLVGYTEEGFVILNSSGEDWSELNVSIDGTDVSLKGMALWHYDDWAASIIDGWVLRLAVPGQRIFSHSRNIIRGGKRVSGSTPYRELQGNFLNIEDGRCTVHGKYSTPNAYVKQMVGSLVNELKEDECRGLIIRIPGILQPIADGFATAVRYKNLLNAHGLKYFTCFWCADFADQVNDILKHTFERCRNQSGRDAEHLDSLFEQTTSGAGRAFWRDINRNAKNAVSKCRFDGVDWSGGHTCNSDETSGIFGDVFHSLARACEYANKPLHLIVDGAGSLVLDALVQNFCGPQRDRALKRLPRVQSLTATMPASPYLHGKNNTLALAELIHARDGEKACASIIVPSPEAESRLGVYGYGKSILNLVSVSFSEGTERSVLLGMSDAAREYSTDPDRFDKPFKMFEPKSAYRIDQRELEEDPTLDRLVLTNILDAQTEFEKLRTKGNLKMSNMTLSQLERQLEDGTITLRDAEPYLQIIEGENGPLSVSVGKVFVDGEPRPRSAAILNIFNHLYAKERRNDFLKRTRNGYDGPRIAAEGDSWFQYPLRLEDTIDWIGRTYPVYCVSAAGDLLEKMTSAKQYLDAIQKSDADILLLSAGGNDLCAGGKLIDHLEQFQDGFNTGDCLKNSYNNLIESAIGWYGRICTDVAEAFPKVRVVVHGYDYPIPNPNGKWLGKPMTKCGIPVDVQRDLSREMVDRFNRSLRRMAQKMPHVDYVDCRGLLADNEWHDEFHPTDGGYEKVANRIMEAVSAIPLDRSGPAPAIIQAHRTTNMSLHVGINTYDPVHYGPGHDLAGCENDAAAMAALARNAGFEPRKFISESATRDTVLAELREAARVLKTGDHFLFSFSGHGIRVDDYNGDEDPDGDGNKYDSALCLYDTILIDDEIYNEWRNFREGVRITFVTDCCHSGTVARQIPFVPGQAAAAPRPTNLPGRIREIPDMLAQQLCVSHDKQYRNFSNGVDHVSERQILVDPNAAGLKASLIQIAACQDDQVAWDGGDFGAFTKALLAAWDDARFDGGHHNFIEEVISNLSQDQSPRLFVLCQNDSVFLPSKPFTTVGSRTQARPVPKPVVPSHPIVQGIDQVEGDEGAESDVDPKATMARVKARSAPKEDPVVTRFDAFLKEKVPDLTHFSPSEFLYLGDSHYSPSELASGLNRYPPEELWGNIVPVAKALQELRSRIGVQVRISSAYRNSAYNHAVGGVSSSFHTKFLACDVSAKGKSPDEVWKILDGLRSDGVFAGGLGRYRSFTHIDARGSKADWDKRVRGIKPRGTLFLDSLQPVRIPADVKRPRSGAPAGDLLPTEADTAVNGSAIVNFDNALDSEMRNAVLYTTQFAERVADQKVQDPANHFAWWATYCDIMQHCGWSTQDFRNREFESDGDNTSIDTVALQAIGEFAVQSQLTAIGKILGLLKSTDTENPQMKLLHQFTSRGKGHLFQVGAASLSDGYPTLAMGMVRFETTIETNRVLFINRDEISRTLWVAARKLSFNVNYYRTNAQEIVEGKLRDARSAILALELAPL